MSEHEGNRDPGETPVRLNETFERLQARDTRREAEVDTVTERETPKSAAPEQTASPPPRRGGAAGVLAMLLAMIAIGIASWAAYTLWQMQREGRAGNGLTELDSRVDALERQVESPRDRSPDVEAALERLTALEREVDEKLAAVDDLNARLDDVTARLASRDVVSPAELDELRGRIAETVDALRNEMGTSPQDWLLAEVEYLVRLGAQRVEMQQDARGALAMFEAADDILASSEGVTAFSLREALANDIAELRAVDTIDVDGIYVRLGALKSLVDELRQPTPAFTPEPADIDSAPADAGLGQQAMTFIENVGSRLASLVDYRRDEESIKPVLPPEQEYYLRQNLLFKLQLAQLALLQENQAVYDNSLGEAQEWLERHFDPEHRVVQTLQASLDELEGLDITREMPDVSESLRAVRETLKRFHRESQRNLVQ